jgi:hypothetical protein
MVKKDVRGKRGNPHPKLENLKRFGIEKPPPDHDFAVRNGKKGGSTAAKTRQLEINMDTAFMAVMGKKVGGDIKKVLETNGYDTDELDNAHAIMATLVALALKDGDLQAIKILLDYSQSINEEARKSEESKARIESIKANMGSNLSVNSSDDDDGGVVIYLPKIEDDDEDENEQGKDSDGGLEGRQ